MKKVYFLEKKILSIKNKDIRVVNSEVTFNAQGI